MATASTRRGEFRDLFEPRSLIGAVAVLAVLCVFGFGLRMVAEAVRNESSFAVGQPVAVTPTTTFTPAADWVSDPSQTVDGVAVVAHRNGWEMKLVGGLILQPGQTLEDYAAVLRDEGDDPSAQVGELETFVTTGGLHGVRWETHRATDVSIGYLIANGGDFAQLLAEGSSATLDSVEDDLNAMAASITVSDGGS